MWVFGVYVVQPHNLHKYFIKIIQKVVVVVKDISIVIKEPFRIPLKNRDKKQYCFKSLFFQERKSAKLLPKKWKFFNYYLFFSLLR